MKRIGVITSGGDAPGTNACIRTLARRCLYDGVELCGIFDSWDGLLKDKVRPLTRDDVTNIVQRAGTILRSARSRLFLAPGDAEVAKAALAKHGLEGLIVIGGNGSQTAAHILAQSGYPCVGVPKTIDNDLAGTELTVGFLTAVETATAALDNLRATAEAHNRVMVVEVMGRNVGWIAVECGIAGGADIVLIPEFEFTLEEVCARIEKRHTTLDRNYSLVVIAEGAIDKVGVIDPKGTAQDKLGRPKLGGVGPMLAREIEDRLGYDARCTTLGYLQRSAAPCAADRILATRVTDKAYDLLLGGESGMMAGLQGRDVKPVPLADVAGKEKRVTRAWARLAELFG
ncbi:MAG: 6-phosphofructokinase [Planctomycetes bacterium]|nr:6-phosphofructokinase [Planctomycetota bacterium]MCW8135827.1 6-phosphofructokinase [Planctomycetota bacterium]